MKLFSTLLMSLAVSASAYAGVSAVKMAASPLAQQHKGYATLSALNAQPTKAAVKATDKVANAAMKSVTPMDLGIRKAAKKAPAATAEVVELFATEYVYDWEYYPESADWYCAVSATTGVDSYLIRLDAFSDNADSPVGEYGVDDWDYNYTWGAKNDIQTLYTSVTAVVTEGEGGYEVDATIETDGGETLHLVVKPQPHEAQEINIEGFEMTTASYYDLDQDWWVAFRDAEGMATVYLDLINPVEPGVFAGTYTENDILENYTYVAIAGRNYYFDQLNVVTEGEDPTISCEITGEGFLANGDHVTFHMLRMPPIDPKEHVTVDATLDFVEFNSAAYNNNSAIVATAADKQFQIVYSGVTGDFNKFAAGSGYVDAEGNICAVDNGTLYVEVGSDNSLTIEAELVCQDSICYDININSAIEVKGEKEIICHDWQVADLFGLIYYVLGSNEEGIQVQAALMYYPEEGDFTEDVNFFVIYPDDSEASGLVVKSAVFSYDEVGFLQLDGAFLGSDFVDYTVHVDFILPEIVGEREFVSEAGVLTDLSYDLGAIQISVDGEDWFSVVLDMDELASGHFSEVSSTYASYCNIVLDQMGAAEQYQMYTCDFDLATDGDLFFLNGTCQAGEYLWHVDISGYVQGNEPGGNQYDDPDNDLDEVFAAEDIVTYQIDSDNGYAYIQANDGVRVFSTLIYIDGDVLEAGTYPIVDEYVAGTVQPGDCDGSSVYPTFYGTLTEDGYINVPLWLCVEGSLTVSYDAAGEISLDCVATNTWGRSAHIVVNPQSTVGIENVAAAKAANGKFYENNNFVIRNNGAQYNAFGQMTK